jgi:hypothetical protein
MEFIAVIDISSFIWCQNHFDANTSKYYELMQSLPNLFTKITDNKTNVLLRKELYEQILSNFPYRIIPNENFDFQVTTLGFLTTLGSRMIEYPSTDITSISSIPDISKQHFNGNTKVEVRYLLNRMHTQRTPPSKFFTFGYLWNYEGNLNTIDDNDKVNHEIETICYDNELSLNNFFSNHRRMFDHNPKHNLFNAGEIISPLSCYNERIGNKDKAQLLLDESEQYNDLFYNFDTSNNVYVIFRNTNSNIYHGYDERNLNNVPSEIRRKFNK